MTQGSLRVLIEALATSKFFLNNYKWLQFRFMEYMDFLKYWGLHLDSGLMQWGDSNHISELHWLVVSNVGQNNVF